MSYRILQLISSSGFFGAENVLLELSTELRELGHSVTIGVFDNRHNPNLEILNNAKGRLIDTQVFKCNGRLDLKTVKQIGSYIRTNSIDIIHSHGYKSNIYAFLANLKNKKPLVTTCHNWIGSSLKLRLYTCLDKAILKKFDQIIPVAKTVKEKLLKIGITEERITLIENGVDIEKFRSCEKGESLKKELVPDPSRKVIGTISRLTREKGVSCFLEAAKVVLKRRPDCFFLVVGEGMERRALGEKARSLGISDQVIFTGTRSDIPEILSIIDIFVLPSLVEGQPMALLEAMASQKAIVATEVGDVPKILRNGEIGFVVPPGDSDALARGILFYLENSDQGLKSGMAAHREAMEKYSSSRMAGEYLKLYHHCIRD